MWTGLQEALYFFYGQNSSHFKTSKRSDFTYLPSTPRLPILKVRCVHWSRRLIIVKTPPTIAHKLVKKVENDLYCSSILTRIGEISKKMNKPGNPFDVIEVMVRKCCVAEYWFDIILFDPLLKLYWVGTTFV